MSFTTMEIVDRLKILWRKLEDEGHYVSANTVQLAVVRLMDLNKANTQPGRPEPAKEGGSMRR